MSPNNRDIDKVSFHWCTYHLSWYLNTIPLLFSSWESIWRDGQSHIASGAKNKLPQFAMGVWVWYGCNGQSINKQFTLSYSGGICNWSADITILLNIWFVDYAKMFIQIHRSIKIIKYCNKCKCKWTVSPYQLNFMLLVISYFFSAGYDLLARQESSHHMLLWFGFMLDEKYIQK